jgi:uncharacterized membrane protein YbhN (UPF0104 family)
MSARVRPARITAVLLGVLALSLLLSLPGVGEVLGGTDAALVAAAVALELASELSFVVVFRLFFDRLDRRDARAIAWGSLASGALLPGGGVGGAAVGGWLATLTGAPAAWTVRRSSGLFFVTTGINAIALVGAGLVLAAGAAQPRDFLRTWLPVLLAVAATAAVLAAPAVARRGRPRAWVRGVADGIDDARRAARRPTWRLLGAVGYLGFDVAVLGTALSAVGGRMPVAGLVLAYLIGWLAAALPVPGGLGALDAGLAGALVLYGAAPAHAAAAVLIYHAVSLAVPAAGGAYALVRLRPRLRAARIDRVPVAEPA